MKLSENVEIKSNQVKTTNSRASRMARYSAAAAGVAAVSTLDVDAAMIKVIVTDPSAVNTSEYTLDLSEILSGASIKIWWHESMFDLSHNGTGKTELTAYSSMGSILGFGSGQPIGATLGGSRIWSIVAWSSIEWLDPGKIFRPGFRVDHGGNDHTYGWLKGTQGTHLASFTLSSYGYNSTLNEAAIAGQGSTSSQVPDTGPGFVGIALLGAGAAGMRLLRKLRVGI